MQQPQNLFSLHSERRQVALFFFISGVLSTTWSVRIPDVQKKLQLTEAGLGQILAVLPAGLIFGLFFASWVTARWGVYKVTTASCFAICGSLVLAGITASPVVLAAILFVLGMCRTVYNIAINTGAVAVQEQRSKPIISTFHGIWSLACLFTIALGTLFIAMQTPLPVHFTLLALFIILVTAALYRKLPGHTAEVARRPFFILPDTRLFLIGLLAFCAMLCEGAMFDWSVLYFEQAVQAPRAWITLGYGCFIVTMTLGRLAGDRFLSRVGPYRLLVLNGLVMATGFLLIRFFPHPLIASFGFLLIGLGDATLVPVIYMLATQTKKMPAGYALSSVTLIGYTGFLVGPLWIGFLARHGNLQTALGSLTLLALLVCVFSMVVRRWFPA